MRIYLLSIFISFIFLINLLSNNNYSVDEICFVEDYPISDISKVCFGKNGLLWIGTNNGLFYFDGYNFSSETSLFLNSKTLSDDNIKDITQDPDGNIWLLTQYGVEKFNIVTIQPERIIPVLDVESVKGILHSSDTSLLYVITENAVLALNTQNKKLDTLLSRKLLPKCSPMVYNNSLWLGEAGGLIRVDEKSSDTEIYKFPALFDNPTVVMEPLDSNNLLIGLDEVLYTFHISTKRFEKLITLPTEIIDISAVFNNKVSLASLNTVFLFDLDTNSFALEKLTSINNAIINNIALDVNGIVWVATSKTILKINPFSINFKYKAFLQNTIDSPLDNYYVFEAGKSGVVYKNRKNEFYYYNSRENKQIGLPIDNCNAVCEYNGSLFIGQLNKLVRLNLKSGIVDEVNYALNVYSIKVIDKKLWVATDQGVFSYSNGVLNMIYDGPVIDFFIKDRLLYVISDEGISSVDSKTGSVIVIVEGNLKSNLKVNDILQSKNDEVWIASNEGLFQFNSNPDTGNEKNSFKVVFKRAVYALIEFPELSEIWYSSDVGVGMIDYKNSISSFFGKEDGVTQNTYLEKGAYIDNNKHVNFVIGKQVLNFNPQKVYRNKISNQVIISKAIFVGKEKTETRLFYNSDTLIVLPNIRFLELELTTFDYFSPQNTKFEYSLEPIGHASAWREVQGINKLIIGALKPGNYELKIKTINSYGVESSEVKNLTIIVKVPILQSKWAYAGYFVVLIILVVLLIRIRTRALLRINREYKERELIAKRVELQKEELTIKNKNITDSINYARRIQLAMMPSVKLFSSIFPDSFVLHMPKDIVSGDFYWMNKVGNKVFFSAVDCTGHGVPGAFMSIIGVELFRRITENEKVSTPAEVLNNLSENFERIFGDVDEMKLRDGMDLAFCALNEEQTVLEFSGAFNPLYIVRDNSIMEIKGDRHSVGVYEEDDNVMSFNNHVVPLNDGDIIYIFTDGFADQFGGPEGKKYKYRRFRHLLLALHQLPLEQQKEFLRKSILEWKGNLDQVDDILVMGLRITQKK
jgi:serine phosphatase RsbU (regulator of sigma subunit)/ligand-binding sensor domain-containing protein